MVKSKKAKVFKSELSGKEAAKLFFDNYLGKWITRNEVKSERVVKKKHRLISKKAWSNLKLRKMFLNNSIAVLFKGD
ncbi:MAG: hypothetical protein ABH803_00915 [Candidatus Micrarchaeota archaeon]